MEPISTYYYQNTGETKHSYLLYKQEGIIIPELEHTLVKGKNKGKKVIYLKAFKGRLELTNPSLKKLYPEGNSQHISKLAGTEIEENWDKSISLKLQGDLQFTKRPILVEHNFNIETEIKLLKIIVFNGSPELSLTLYQKWIGKLLNMTLPINKLKIGTTFVRKGVNK